MVELWVEFYVSFPYMFAGWVEVSWIWTLGIRPVYSKL